MQDEAIRNRLHHLHSVQSAFCWAVKAGGSQFERTTLADFASPASLKAYAQRASTELTALIETMTDDQLTQAVHIPWFKDPPGTFTRADALTQAVMHSHWHRGQNATRLRELGGVPPTTDFIVWIKKGRPPAQW